MSRLSGIVVVAFPAMSTLCESCRGSGLDPVFAKLFPGEDPMECSVCRSKGRMSFWDRLRLWNDGNPSGSFPGRARCWLLRHDWDSIETLHYCLRCHATWDIEWEETPVKVRF